MLFKNLTNLPIAQTSTYDSAYGLYKSNNPYYNISRNLKLADSGSFVVGTGYTGGFSTNITYKDLNSNIVSYNMPDPNILDVTTIFNYQNILTNQILPLVPVVGHHTAIIPVAYNSTTAIDGYANFYAEKPLNGSSGIDDAGFYAEKFTKLLISGTSANSFLTLRSYYTSTSGNTTGETAEPSTISSTSYGKLSAYNSSKFTMLAPSTLINGSTITYQKFRVYSDYTDYNTFLTEMVIKYGRYRIITGPTSHLDPTIGQTLSSLVFPITEDGYSLDTVSTSSGIPYPDPYILCRRSSSGDMRPLQYGDFSSPSSIPSGYGYTFLGRDQTQQNYGYYNIDKNILIKSLSGKVLATISYDIIKTVGFPYSTTNSESQLQKYTTYLDGYEQFLRCASVDYTKLLDLYNIYGECEIVLTVSGVNNEPYGTGTGIPTSWNYSTKNFSTNVSFKLYARKLKVLAPELYDIKTTTLASVYSPVGTTQYANSAQAYSAKSVYDTNVYETSFSSNTAITNNTINLPNHLFVTGQTIKYSFTTTSVVGLTAGNTYYVAVIDKNNIKLCLSYTKLQEQVYVVISNSIAAGTAKLTRDYLPYTVTTTKYLTVTSNLETETTPTQSVIAFQPVNTSVTEFVAKAYSGPDKNSVVKYAQRIPVSTASLPVILNKYYQSNNVIELLPYIVPTTPSYTDPNFEKGYYPTYNTSPTKLNNIAKTNFLTFSTRTNIVNQAIKTTLAHNLTTGTPVRFLLSSVIGNITAVNTLTSTLYKIAHGLTTGDKVVYLADNNVSKIIPLIDNNMYYVTVIDSDNFKLSNTAADVLSQQQIQFATYGSFNNIEIIQVGSSIQFNKEHGLITGDAVVYRAGKYVSSTGAITTNTMFGYLDNTIYYAVVANVTSITIASTYADAVNATPVTKLMPVLGTFPSTKLWPNPLNVYDTYYAIRVDANTVKLAATEDNAYNNIPININPAITNSTAGALAMNLTAPTMSAGLSSLSTISSNTTSTITVPVTLNTGDSVVYTTGTSTIGGLVTTTVYYAIFVSVDTYKLATTYENAVNNVPITFTTTSTTATVGTITKINLVLDAKTTYSISGIGNGIICLQWAYTQSTISTSSANIDGFIIKLHKSTVAGSYLFGTDPTNETRYVVPFSSDPANPITANRITSAVISNLNSNFYYHIAISSYRVINRYIPLTNTNIGDNELQSSLLLQHTGYIQFNSASKLIDSGLKLPDTNTYYSTLTRFRKYDKSTYQYEISQGYQLPKYQLYIDGAAGAIFITDWANAESIRQNYATAANISSVYFAAGADNHRYISKKQKVSGIISIPTRLCKTYSFTTGFGGKK